MSEKKVVAVNLTQEQDAKLRKIAARRQEASGQFVSVSRLVREAVDLLIEQEEQEA